MSIPEATSDSSSDSVAERVEDQTVDPVVEAASDPEPIVSDVLPPENTEPADSPAPELETPADPIPEPEPEPESEISDEIADTENEGTVAVADTSASAEQTTEDVAPGSAGKQVTRDTRPKRKLGWRKFILGGSGGTR